LRIGGITRYFHW